MSIGGGICRTGEVSPELLVQREWIAAHFIREKVDHDCLWNTPEMARVGSGSAEANLGRRKVNRGREVVREVGRTLRARPNEKWKVLNAQC
jgi:hypothetical protein